jgi:phosphate transport system substrate-binding protein
MLAATVFSSTEAHGQRLEGHVKVDGSSTVYRISTAMAELFAEKQPRVRVTVGVSGTGGGFKKFLTDRPALRTDINDASRAIKPAEQARAKELGIEYVEFAVALDGIANVVNPSNTWCNHLTVEELQRIWEPGSTINNWKQVRAGFPDKPLRLYGPGTDSGTFDFFTETINGKEKACRSDFTASESDNVLVQGVAGDEGGLGYFGYAYFEANQDKLKLLAVDAGDGKLIEPSIETVRTGTYRPLSRPLFIYVNAESLKRPEVRAYLEFYLESALEIVEHPQVGYMALPQQQYEAQLEKLRGLK